MNWPFIMALVLFSPVFAYIVWMFALAFRAVNEQNSIKEKIHAAKAEGME